MLWTSTYTANLRAHVVTPRLTLLRVEKHGTKYIYDLTRQLGLLLAATQRSLCRPGGLCLKSTSRPRTRLQNASANAVARPMQQSSWTWKQGRAVSASRVQSAAHLKRACPPSLNRDQMARRTTPGNHPRPPAVRPRARSPARTMSLGWPWRILVGAPPSGLGALPGPLVKTSPRSRRQQPFPHDGGWLGSGGSSPHGPWCDGHGGRP